MISWLSVASGGVELWSKRPLHWRLTPVVLWRAFCANRAVGQGNWVVDKRGDVVAPVYDVRHGGSNDSDGT